MKKVFLLFIMISSLSFASVVDANKAIDKKDYKTAIVLLKKMAYEGMIAKYKLAQMHEYGWGVQKDINKAIFIYTLSANDGYEAARNRLGDIYLEGIGVKKDLEMAIKYHELAAQQGNLDSIEILKSLKKDTKKTGLAYITIRSNVSNDKVYVNEEFVGSTKITLPIQAGKVYKIKVKKDGYTTYSFKDVKLKKGQKKSIMGILKKIK